MNNVAGVLGTGPSLFPLAMSLQVTVCTFKEWTTENVASDKIYLIEKTKIGYSFISKE